MRELALYIPGLFGPPLTLTGADLPSLPATERLLGRSRRGHSPGEAYYPLISGLLGLEPAGGRDIPVAAVSRLVEGEEHPEGIWMRADPVHLAADRDRLLLLEPELLSLNRREALALAAEVRGLLEGEGWQLEVPAPERWYVRMAHPPEVTTTDLPGAAAQDINSSLPAGPGARPLHRLLNELQMQLHDSDVNAERAARGELPVNSLWFWGLGGLPAIPPRLWSAVCAHDPFVTGLARLSLTPAGPVPDSPADLLAAAAPDCHTLVVLDHCRLPARYADLGGWGQGLQRLEQDWLAPLLEDLRAGRLQRLDLLTEGGAFSVTRPGLARFWRRDHGLLRFSRQGHAA